MLMRDSTLQQLEGLPEQQISWFFFFAITVS